MDNTTPFSEQNIETNPSFNTEPSYQGPPAVAPTLTTPTSPAKSPKKIRYIIFGSLAILVLILAVILIIVCLTRNDTGDTDTDTSTGTTTTDITNDGSANSDTSRNISTFTTSDMMASVAFRDLTKAEAMAFLQAQVHGAGSVIPTGYVDKEMTDSVIISGRNRVVSDLRLIYSYDDIDELSQKALEAYRSIFSSQETVSKDDFEIEEYDYYAIVTPNRIKGAASCNRDRYDDCDSLLSFKRNYLDRFQEQSSPTSYNDVSYINARDPEVVNKLLRAYTFFIGTNGGGYGTIHGNIYSYSFEDQNDQFVLAVNYVSIGLDPEALSNVSSANNFDMSEAYVISLYTRYFTVDKADGRIHSVPVQTEPEVAYLERVKSFPIAVNEATTLTKSLIHQR